MEEKEVQQHKEHLSLNDDRRVKVLSPGMLVAKRFFRNKIAVVGLVILVAMFLFSFGGAIFSPYGEKQYFYKEEVMRQPIGGAKELLDLSFTSANGSVSSSLSIPAKRAIEKGDDRFSIKSKGAEDNYTITDYNGRFFEIYKGNDLAFIAFYNSVNFINEGEKLTFDFRYAALKAYEQKPETEDEEPVEFTVGETVYSMDENGDIFKGETDYAYILSYSINATEADRFFSKEFKFALIDAAENGELGNDKEIEFKVTENGEEKTYFIYYDASKNTWDIKEYRYTRVYDRYSAPSSEHWLGTDGHGMDMLTRLMYGGRVSLLVGFIVVIIETILGVIMGGISGYFGRWVDNLIMRIVDVFYCIPSTPLLIILGAMMDAMEVDPTLRMIYLMLTLGFLGWPGVARLVRGQILSLREQEFMTATEACGISVRKRIFRHLIPNVIPQLIVTCTMGLGSTIIIEATLSFLGLGVRFPFASWGNIINDVNNIYVLTNYLFVWIPAGVCIVLTVLAFNLVGDGLRDAFDPKMKR